MNFTLKPKAIQTAVAKLQFRTEAFIDGKFCPSTSGKTYASINPANGKKITTIAACEAADINRAVAVARKAFADGRWSRMAAGDRKAVMLKFVER